MDGKPKSVSELFPSKWIRAEDLNGKTFVLTISKVTIESVNDAFTKTNVDKGVVWFQGAQKGLILNVTQAKEIAKLVGSEDFDKWPGHKVCLRPGWARNGKPTIIVNGANEKMV